MDRLYEAACEVENTIEESVAAEEFADAVRLRGVHAELQDQDEVNTVLKVRPHSRSFHAQLGCLGVDLVHQLQALQRPTVIEAGNSCPFGTRPSQS